MVYTVVIETLAGIKSEIMQASPSRRVAFNQARQKFACDEEGFGWAKVLLIIPGRNEIFGDDCV